MHRPLLLQILLFAVGGVVMLATGAWILPGVPFLILIKLLHQSRFHLGAQQTLAYKTAARLAASFSKQLLVDPRDERLMLVSLGCAISSTVLTAAVILKHVAAPGQIHWPVVLLRQAVMTSTLVIAFTAKHQESHRSRRNTYKHAALQASVQRINEWWTGIFYGNVPEIDRCGHGFVHHRNEVERDDWANAHLDRADPFHFMQWVITAGMWHNSGVGLLVEFYHSGCFKLMKQTAVGMTVYYLLAAAVYALAGHQLFWILFAWPFLANIGFGSVVNWSWHIFADPANPHNYAACTITVLDWAGDVFSEGFHLTHHLKPAAHYSDMCQVYTADRDYYIANNSLLLTNSDPLEIWAMSMLQQWGYFASRLVDFSGKMTSAQKRAFVRYRTRPVGSKPANALEASAAKLAAAAATEAAMRMTASEQQLKHFLTARTARPMVTVLAGVE